MYLYSLRPGTITLPIDVHLKEIVHVNPGEIFLYLEGHTHKNRIAYSPVLYLSFKSEEDGENSHTFFHLLLRRKMTISSHIYFYKFELRPEMVTHRSEKK